MSSAAEVAGRRRVLYAREDGLTVDAFRHVLARSGLGDIRPLADADRLGRMLAGSNLVVTARFDATDGPLVGVARCVTDFAWCCYLSDLAVSSEAQGHGVGKGLVDAVRRELGPEATLVLVSVPDAVGFYERIGMQPVDGCFWIRRER